MGQGEPGGESAVRAGGVGLRTALIAIAALIGVAAVAGVWLNGRNTSAQQSHVILGGPFALVDQNGRPVTQAVLQGKRTALFFGYVSCPDVCPATLQTLAAAEHRLGVGPNELQIVFVTVDPARDTPAQLKAYLDQPDFPKGVIGLTGAPEQVDQAAKAYRAYYKKEGTGADYAMAHSAAIYLIGPDGQFQKALTFQQGPDLVAQELKAFLAGA